MVGDAGHEREVTLDDLLTGLTGITMTSPVAHDVTGLAYDSRRVQPGDLFFALPGLQHDGTVFVPDAVARGAVAVVARRAVDLPGIETIVSDEPRRTLAEAACRLYGDPSRALRMVGVTGTNGKTTTTYLVESVLREAGVRAGLVGTTGVRVAGTRRPSAFTTPEAPELQALLREMVDAGVGGVAIEVSSHALVQRRAFGIEFDVVAFTNLTQDHLDFHGDMATYLDAKRMLFDGRNGGSLKPTKAVILHGSPGADAMRAAALEAGREVVSVCAALDAAPGADRLAANDADVAITSVRPGPAGLDLAGRAKDERGRGADFAFRLPLLGRYNAENAAVAFGCGLGLGFDASVIVRGLERTPGVPGRLERVDAGQPFAVVVDYAHTPDALAHVLEAVRDHSGGRVLLVFGCGGDRDRGKRPRMGAIAAAKADLAWITNDNPRGEDPRAIASEVAAGAPAGALRVVLDRREAIAAAFAEARAGDLVMIAGKGHETTQTIGDHVLPFDDRQVARELLGGRAGAEG